ncbi:hypothetical protein A9996_18985 [Gelidibacter algens]|nr:hypothetical protein A9996_18985 [Gelidibacter algens]
MDRCVSHTRTNPNIDKLLGISIMFQKSTDPAMVYTRCYVQALFPVFLSGFGFFVHFDNLIFSV